MALGYIVVEESEAHIIENSGSPLLTETMDGFKPLFTQYQGQP